MKNYSTVGHQGSSGECKQNVAPLLSRTTFAFTLIELLTVISIIAVLAAFSIPVISSIKRKAIENRARAELVAIETAIDRYKAAYGAYPPDNHLTPANPMINQLYYELVGTTNVIIAGIANFQPLDGQGVTLPDAYVNLAFGLGGFVNCSKLGGGEEASSAKSFLTEVKPNQIGLISNNVAVSVLVCSVGGPDQTYQPIPGVSDLNPWRYNSSNPTNNPGSYDLWVQLSIGGKKYLICNWSGKNQINNPLP